MPHVPQDRPDSRLDDRPDDRPDDASEGGLVAVILAGGRGSRLGGISKPLARFGDRTLLDLAIGAVPGGSAIVVVGPPELTVPIGVRRVREDPPFGGPVAALAAGLAAVPQEVEWLLLLAADQPTVDASVRILLTAPRGNDGVIGIDGSGRRQPLAALYRAAAVREVVGDGSSAPRRLLDVAAGLTLAEIWLGDRLDVDTADDARHFGVLTDLAPQNLAPQNLAPQDLAHQNVTENVTDPDRDRRTR